MVDVLLTVALLANTVAIYYTNRRINVLNARLMSRRW